MNDLGVKPVYANPVQVPAKRPASLWDRAVNRYWNWKRRPKVKEAQRRVIEIAEYLKQCLEKEMLPTLWQVRMVCRHCHDMYGMLKFEPFSSTIRSLLKFMPCPNHPEVYREFLLHHEVDFEASEKLAAWINGFTDDKP